MAAAGDKISGFTLVRQLGAGGMGETWEAVRVVGADFEQRVAIKVADRDSLQTREGMDLFRREASLAASLRHPNIAAVLDVDESRGCIICELVEGADMRAVLRASPRSILSARLLVLLLGQVARGLSHAHRRVLHGKLSPVVHRDMSPGNLVLDYDGNLKIVDFGIAKAIASADISETIKGKLSYMAPEQAMASRIDGRVDQYAVGVMAYEALTGVRPNDGAHDGETLANILSGKHMPLKTRARDVPPGLADLIERMLSVAPEQRFTSMDAVLDALDPFTPPFTTHRELAELVLRARPAQTIVMQDGVFVSRPVSQHNLQREPTPRGSGGRTREVPRPATSAGPAAALALREPLGSSSHTHTQPARAAVPPRPALPLHDEDSERASDARLAGRTGSGRRQALFAGAGALVLGALSWMLFSADGLSTSAGHATTPVTSTNAATSPASAPPSLAAPLPPSRTGQTAPAQPISTAVAPPPAAEFAANAQGANARGGTQATGPAATPATQNAPDAAHKNAPDLSFSVADVKPRRVARDKDKERERDKDKDKDRTADSDAANTAKATGKNTAIARVKVFPWGRVWVDGKLQGSVPPILELYLTPGAHEIAVGHERPMDSRNVNLQAGATQLVAFDLEGR